MNSGLAARLRGRLRRWIKPEPKGRPRPSSQDFALAVPFAEEAIAKTGFRIAVMIHLFHAELAAEFRSLCEAIPAPCDLLITTDSKTKSDAIRAVLGGWQAGLIEVRIAPNRGRDIAPKLTTYRDEYPNYDLILFLHSKKSGTVDWGDSWRKQILSSLVGNQRTVASILTLFAHDASLGIVAPKTYERVHAMMRWGDTKDAVALAQRLGLRLDLDAPFDFPAGSMFWARPAALGPLLDLGLTAADFPEEAGQTDATPAHAVERLFYVVCEKAGFSWIKVADPDYFEDTKPLLMVNDGSDLDRAIKQSGWRVSDTMLK